MPIAGELQRIAAELARTLKGRISELQRDLAEVEEKKRAIQEQLEAARLSTDRTLDFQPQIGADFQCPRCWIEHEKRCTLTRMGGGTRTEDFFHCRACGLQISIPF